MMLVADTGRLHLTSGNQSLCGLSRQIEAVDVHEQDAGRRVWEERVWQRCEACEQIAGARA